MKTNLAKLFLFAQKIKPQHVQVVFTLLVAGLFLVGVRSPDSGGGMPH